MRKKAVRAWSLKGDALVLHPLLNGKRGPKGEAKAGDRGRGKRKRKFFRKALEKRIILPTFALRKRRNARRGREAKEKTPKKYSPKGLDAKIKILNFASASRGKHEAARKALRKFFEMLHAGQVILFNNSSY